MLRCSIDILLGLPLSSLIYFQFRIMAVFEVSVAFIFTFLLEMVNGKQCQHIFETGQIHYFDCSAFEFCCGPRCCRSRAITFYQLWYFWLMVFLTMLLCSGGGWWYRFHRNMQLTHPSRVMMSHHATGGQTTTPGTYYTSGVTTTAPQTFPSAPQFSPPPPYSGPPPSYDSVVKQQSHPN